MRVLTGDQLTRLHFWNLALDSRDRTRRRVLARLVTHSLAATLDRRIGGARSGSAGTVYALDVAGQRALPLLGADVAMCGPTRARAPWTPGLPFLGHSLAISGLYSALREHERTRDLALVQFTTEPNSWHPD